MKQSHLQLNGLLFTSIMLFSAAGGSLTARAENSSPKSNAASQINTNATEIPRSVFTIPTRAADGRDPFFPLSRRMVVEAKPVKGGDSPAPVSLTLKGIARAPGGGRFALINDKTFAAGEEREVVMNNSRVRVHCLEIKEDSAVVEVNGARQDLRLRPGL